MHSRSTGTLEDDGGETAAHKGPFSFIRAAAGFVLEDAPAGGVFAGPPAVPDDGTVVTPATDAPHGAPEAATAVGPPAPGRHREPTPMAHRLMVFALVPFLAIAAAGLVVITLSSDPEPDAVSRVVTSPVPTTVPPEPADDPVPPVEAPSTTAAPPVAVPVAPVARAPRTTTTVATTVPPAPTSETTEPPVTTTTVEPSTTTTEAPTTTTTEPPATTTTTGAPQPLEPVE